MIWQGQRLSFVVSFHDLAPHSWDACRLFLDDMHSIGVERVSLLVVPQWHGGEDTDQNTDFAAWLRDCAAQGHEITLHGYTHLADSIDGGLLQQFMGNIYTAREGEFYQLNYEDALANLQRGKDMFERMGLKTRGFVAPAWLLSPDARRALIDSGFEFTTYWNRVEALQQNIRINAPTLTFSCRTLLRRTISKPWVRFWKFYNHNAPVLRLAVHPGDLKYPAVRDMLKALAREALLTRQPMTYADVADGCSPRKTGRPATGNSAKDAMSSTNP
ncbi:MAG: polysaccharide deacetylase family protein [Candidatus Hinthialibacter antarcticus]|nr:polysaccharide deacetylase family protein [Candidatus Hinthialibacter antarcticus]